MTFCLRKVRSQWVCGCLWALQHGHRQTFYKTNNMLMKKYVFFSYSCVWNRSPEGQVRFYFLFFCNWSLTLISSLNLFCPSVNTWKNKWIKKRIQDLKNKKLCFFHVWNRVKKYIFQEESKANFFVFIILTYTKCMNTLVLNGMKYIHFLPNEISLCTHNKHSIGYKH